MSLVPNFIGWRQLWKHEGLLNMDWRGQGPTPITERADSYEDATLVGSATGYGEGDDAYHFPVLDIDFKAALVPSSTEDHYHLYLNHGMTWAKYEKLLEALYEADVIQEGYYKMAVARKQTFVRRPGVYKREGEQGSA